MQRRRDVPTSGNGSSGWRPYGISIAPTCAGLKYHSITPTCAHANPAGAVLRRRVANGECARAPRRLHKRARGEWFPAGGRVPESVRVRARGTRRARRALRVDGRQRRWRARALRRPCDRGASPAGARGMLCALPDGVVRAASVHDCEPRQVRGSCSACARARSARHFRVPDDGVPNDPHPRPLSLSRRRLCAAMLGSVAILQRLQACLT